MNAAVAVRERTSADRVAPLGRMLWKQCRAQGWLLLRQPAVGLVAVALPVMLYVLFALPTANRPYSPTVSMGAYMLASLGTYGVGLIMVFSFGMTVAIDRGQKNDLLMRATPLPPAIDMGARAILGVVFSVVAMTLLFAVAYLGGVRLAPASWVALMSVLVIGGLPLLGLSFTLAYLTGPGAAAAIINMVYMILAFASGLLVPLTQLPQFVQDAAVYLPTYHSAQLGWGAVGVPSEDLVVSIAWLAGYAVLFSASALWVYRRDASRRFR